MEPNSLCSARLYNKGNGHKLLLGRFRLDVRKHFLTRRPIAGTIYPERQKILSLWRFSSRLDRDTAEPIRCWRQPCFKQELGLGKRSLLINISMTMKHLLCSLEKKV